ncbi:hypothetical protein BaRGS_00036275, partial [Batillaria attramentaria]
VRLPQRDINGSILLEWDKEIRITCDNFTTNDTVHWFIVPPQHDSTSIGWCHPATPCWSDEPGMKLTRSETTHVSELTASGDSRLKLIRASVECAAGSDFVKAKVLLFNISLDSTRADTTLIAVLAGGTGSGFIVLIICVIIVLEIFKRLKVLEEHINIVYEGSGLGRDAALTNTSERSTSKLTIKTDEQGTSLGYTTVELVQGTSFGYASVDKTNEQETSFGYATVELEQGTSFGYASIDNKTDERETSCGYASVDNKTDEQKISSGYASVELKTEEHDHASRDNAGSLKSAKTRCALVNNKATDTSAGYSEVEMKTEEQETSCGYASIDNTGSVKSASRFALVNNNATGTSAGYSDVELKTEEQDTSCGYASIDNTGSVKSASRFALVNNKATGNNAGYSEVELEETEPKPSPVSAERRFVLADRSVGSLRSPSSGVDSAYSSTEDVLSKPAALSTGCRFTTGGESASGLPSNYVDLNDFKPSVCQPSNDASANSGAYAVVNKVPKHARARQPPPYEYAQVNKKGRNRSAVYTQVERKTRAEHPLVTDRHADTVQNAEVEIEAKHPPGNTQQQVVSAAQDGVVEDDTLNSEMNQLPFYVTDTESILRADTSTLEQIATILNGAVTIRAKNTSADAWSTSFIADDPEARVNRSGHCIFTRSLPPDEGVYTVTRDMDGAVYNCTQTWNTRVVSFVNYTMRVQHPPSGPVITGYTTNQVLTAGDNVSLTCTVSGGNPPVNNITFYCLRQNTNVTGEFDSSLSSITVTIDRLRVSDDGTECVCNSTGEWPPDPSLHLEAVTHLNVVADDPEARVNISGHCIFTRSLPPDEGVYTYFLHYQPAHDEQHMVGNITISVPRTPKTQTNCPHHVMEGDTLTCDCTTTDPGSPPSVLQWSGFTSHQLTVHNVTRDMDGAVYNCTQTWNTRRDLYNRPQPRHQEPDHYTGLVLYEDIRGSKRDQTVDVTGSEYENTGMDTSRPACITTEVKGDTDDEKPGDVLVDDPTPSGAYERLQVNIQESNNYTELTLKSIQK